jgi:hypothetical protein
MIPSGREVSAEPPKQTFAVCDRPVRAERID